MGAFVVAGLIILVTAIVAILSEMARGMAAAPSMVDSSFMPIMITGSFIAVLVALTHWIPHIGW